MPIKQCSLVRWKAALGSSILAAPLFLWLVCIQQMSSHRRNPHACRQSLPKSSPSEDPHHRNTKALWAATSGMSRAMIFSQSQNLTLVTPYDRAYSSRGGSIRMTSNFWSRLFKSKVSKSHFKYMGGWAVSSISWFLSRISSLSLGYSSNLSAKPTSPKIL